MALFKNGFEGRVFSEGAGRSGNTKRDQAMMVLGEVWAWKKPFLIQNKGPETRIYKHRKRVA
jgi:hypothetical protein